MGFNHKCPGNVEVIKMENIIIFIIIAVAAIYVGKKFYKTYNRMNQINRDIAKKLNVPLIDLSRKIPQDQKYFLPGSTGHLNNKGNILIAEIISETIDSLLNEDYLK